MQEPEKPVFLVDARCDPAAVRIAGRACFQNSAGLREFFSKMIRSGRRRFVVDFGGCTSMDSTFLGVLAGTALELRRLEPPGSVVLCRMGARNLELVRNLGLHRIMTIDPEGAAGGEPGEALEPGVPKSEIESARLVLRAHEDLVAASPENRMKFQDVLEFLKSRVDAGSGGDE